MKIFGITGLPGSGKSEVGKVIKGLGIPLIRMGDMVWEYVKQQGLSLSPENVGKLANQRRETDGADIWARETVLYIARTFLEENQSFIFVDGVRSLEEVNYFKKRFNDFQIIGVHASPGTRYERIIARKRIDETLSFESFREREQRELSWGLANVIVQSDIMIINEGSLEELQQKIFSLFQEM